MENDEVADILEKLMSTTEITEETSTNWEATYEARKKFNSDISIEQYYDTFKCLKNPSGYILVCKNIMKLRQKSYSRFYVLLS